MSYFFPSPITKKDLSFSKNDDYDSIFNYNFLGGKEALKLLLQSNVKKGDKVVVPSFVCNSVLAPVLELECLPIMMDLLGNETFITNYDVEKMYGAKAVILVHLYGETHPQTASIVSWCEKNDVLLINDFAQSFSLDLLKSNLSNIIISFGPGKSSSAACGGVLINLKSTKEISKRNNSFLAELVVKLKSVNYFNKRIYGEGLLEGILDKIGFKLYSIFIKDSSCFQMSKYQKRMAFVLLNNFERYSFLRLNRWNIIKSSFTENKNFIILNNTVGEKFKLLLFCRSENEFSKYLEINKIPFFRLFKKTQTTKLPFFNKNAHYMFELSIESSIDDNEINRVVSLLKLFKK
tara:strand:+ start:87 stop:1133 length:1047 start_codon:yes stop_codon:yes gene_type:complete